MLLVYISGPITDLRGIYYYRQNIKRAEGLMIELMQLGCSVICPHKNTAYLDGMFTWEEFIETDKRQIEAVDCVVMLPDWRRSKGATAERDHAFLHNIPVYYWPGDRYAIEQRSENNDRKAA